MKHLTTPIKNDALDSLNVGDQITISGTIYTGRDAALPQLVELIKQNKVPFDLNGSVNAHCIQRSGNRTNNKQQGRNRIHNTCFK